jgi:hypothetical protein
VRSGAHITARSKSLSEVMTERFGNAAGLTGERDHHRQTAAE